MKNAPYSREYNRDTLWRTHLGKYVKVRDMEDNHLVNLVRFLDHYKHHPASPGMLPVLLEEMHLRNLKMPDFQVPYHDGRGNLIIWDFKTNGPKVVGKYVPTFRERFAALIKLAVTRVRQFVLRAWNAIKPDPEFWGHDDY